MPGVDPGMAVTRHGCPLPPLTESWDWLWLQEAVCLKTRGRVLLKSLTFGPFLYENDQKAFSLPPDPL